MANILTGVLAAGGIQVKVLLDELWLTMILGAPQFFAVELIEDGTPKVMVEVPVARLTVASLLVILMR